MEPLRLDPADPLASVLRWLTALAQALGIDLAAGPLKIRLNRASAAKVRGWLAAWSRQLRALIRAEAARLAASLRPAAPSKRRAPKRAGARPAASRTARPASSVGRFFAVAASARRAPVRWDAGAQRRLDAAALIDPAEEAALRRRTRAVLLALRDPSVAALRLAKRLALRLACARAARAALAGRRRFALPPRILGRVPNALSHAPELRPPDRRAAAFRPAARPAVSAAAAPARARDLC